MDIQQDSNVMESMNGEEWRDIDACNDYEVSNRGRVRNKRTGRFIKPWVTHCGYLLARMCKNSHVTAKYVHFLVLTAFLGPRPEGHQCNHKDGKKDNNDISNLEWVTSRENLFHAKSLNIRRRKLAREEVRSIKYALKENVLSKHDLAEIFKVTFKRIDDIAKEKSWKFVDPFESFMIPLKTVRNIYV